MMKNEKPKNQVAVITGAGGGFGKEITRQLLKSGFRIAATDISAQLLSALKEEMGEDPGLATFSMDVTNVESIIEAEEEIASQFDAPITILVNNAGIFTKNYCLLGTNSENAATIKKVFDINLLGAINCTAVFSRCMAKRRYGRIINIASIAGVSGSALASAYAASKAGLIKLTETWSRELGAYNVIVTAIAPGVCKTPMLGESFDVSSLNVQSEQILSYYIPLGRLGTPEDVAEVVLFLAECRTDYINSAIINLDAGARVGQLS